MKPTVSIIVPVYNAEKFLNRCVDTTDDDDRKKEQRYVRLDL